MDLFVFSAVLVAAVCHAGWNALLKLRLEPIVVVSLISIAGGIVALPLLPLVGIPEVASWPFLVASLIIHLGYYIALGEAYRAGDLGQVYPIARGSAPLLTAVLTTVILGETLGFLGWIGVSVLGAGVLLLSFKGGRALAQIERRAVLFALLTALTIASYTLVDGIGGRWGGSAHAYAAWLIVLDAVMMLVFALVRFPSALNVGAREHWRLALFGGALSTGAYWTAIWAMSVAPIALVAALRETSVLFAAAIGVVLLREPLLPVRVFAAVMVVAGVMLIRLK